MRHEESMIQCECVKWYNLQYPRRLIAAIPNGGQRSKFQGGIMKAEGMKRGFPDLNVPYPRHGYHGLYIEMKIEKGTVKKEQKEIIAELIASGYLVVVCRSFDQFRRIINSYLGDYPGPLPQPYPLPLFPSPVPSKHF